MSTQNLLAQWKEPKLPESLDTNPLILPALGAAALVMIGVGYWQKDWTFYLAATVAAFAAGMLVVQKKKPAEGLVISLAQEELVVGAKNYEITSLAGFWLSAEAGHVIINVEPAKASLFPISFFYENGSSEEARNLFLQVMPELEPRQKTAADTVGKYFKL
ncbi:MAG: hypothetical protein K0S20_218 [Patescibacteria group bacterium]|jgi:hypothetical protein|nr:hypothetical protein [Patescibacteria group bacterium]